MINLKTTRDTVLRYAKRPITDEYWISVANDAINNALHVLQQKVPDFNVLQTVASGIIYPNDIFSSNIIKLTGKYVNKIISVDRLPSQSNPIVPTSGDLKGKPLIVMTYKSLQQKKLDFEQLRVPHDFDSTIQQYSSYANYISQTQGFVVFLMGNSIGLFPSPTIEIYLAVHYTEYTADLEEDSETNEILKNCYEYILYHSLRSLNVLLSESDRISISSSLLQEALDQAVSWNASLDYSNPIEL